MVAEGSLMSLMSLPGLGPRSQHMLAQAGIESADMLRQLGAVEAYLRVKRTGCKPSLNLLWALEGAITGVAWQTVARQERASLLFALDAAESRNAP